MCAALKRAYEKIIQSRPVPIIQNEQPMSKYKATNYSVQHQKNNSLTTRANLIQLRTPCQNKNKTFTPHIPGQPNKQQPRPRENIFCVTLCNERTKISVTHATCEKYSIEHPMMSKTNTVQRKQYHPAQPVLME